MIKKIDHLGIAVTDLDEAVEIYKAIGLEYVGREVVDDQKVATAFFKVGESCFELLAATDPASPIARFIERNGGRGGMQHIALTVDDVEAEIARLKSLGFEMIDQVPRKGAHGNMIAFMHPKSTRGTLLEICAKAG
jgi:methylmalonyl-CoA/ethylmalonyl-CoA epimerase